MANPSTIMGAAALDYWDIAATGSLWQNSDGTTAVADGNPVGRWTGQLATRNLTQPDDTTARPFYEETAQEHLLFDGTNDWIEDTAGYTGAEFYFIGRVYVPTAAADGSRIIQCSNDFAGDGSPGAINTFITGTEIGVILDGFGFLLSPTFPRNQWFTLEIGFSGTEYLIGVDGATTSGSGTGTAPDFDRMTLGANRQSLSAANITPMRLARASTTSALPDSTERTALQDWAENGDVGGAGEITGTLTAQETGSDAASVSGDVAVSGGISAREAGQDTAALEGTVTIYGSVGAQEAGKDGAALSGEVPVSGSLSAREQGADTAELSGETRIAGALSVRETGLDSGNFSGTVAISGELSTRESGADQASLIGGVSDPVIGGFLNAREEGADQAVLSGEVSVSGSLAAREAGSDQASLTGEAPIEGVLNTRETGKDQMSMAGEGARPDISGQLFVREQGSDQAALTGTVTVTGSMAAQESGTDITVMIGSVVVFASLRAVESGSDDMRLRGWVFDGDLGVGRLARPGASLSGGSVQNKNNGGRVAQASNGGRVTR